MPAVVRSLCVPLLCSLFASAGCSDELDAASPAGPDCDSERQACSYFHDFGRTEVAAGEERVAHCFGFKLNNPRDLWVNTVELENDGGFHHSNWFFVPEDKYESPEPSVPCGRINFTELAAAAAGGVVFAQSTLSRSETQKFAPGAAVRVPAYSRIITEAHMLNASAQPLTTGLRLKLQTVPPAQVQVHLAPFRLTYFDLHLPPLRRSEFVGDCNIRAAYERGLGEPFRLQLHYVLPHYHTLGELFTLQLSGGPNSGRVLFDLHDPVGEAHGRTFDPPISLDSSNGLRFTCGFNNPRPQEIGFGTGDQEMCVMLGFSNAPVRLDAAVIKDDKEVGDRMGVSLHTGPCQVVLYPFDDPQPAPT